MNKLLKSYKTQSDTPHFDFSMYFYIVLVYNLVVLEGLNIYI